MPLRSLIVRAEKVLESLPGWFIFGVFCLLIALRDVLTQLLLDGEDGRLAVDGSFLLAAYMVSAAFYAWIFRWMRSGSAAFAGPFLALPRKEKFTFGKLWFCTWVVYAVTLYGIYQLGSTMFNAIDYTVMPGITLIAASAGLHEPISRRQKFGAAVSCLGLVMFMVSPMSSADTSHFALLAVGISLLSPIFTSLSNALQKSQMDHMHADEVLLYRFPVPALLMIGWLVVAHPPMAWSYLPRIFAISLVTVFLPLWLLCLGFVRRPLSLFSSYVFLIPVFTFVLGIGVVKNPLGAFQVGTMGGGLLMLLAGFCIFNGLLSRIFARTEKPKPEPDLLKV